jgi:hypothetical protein
MTLKVHFDGKVFVPDEPVDLPTGAVGEVILFSKTTSTAPPATSLVRPVITAIDPEVGRAIGDDPEFDLRTREHMPLNLAPGIAWL